MLLGVHFHRQIAVSHRKSCKSPLFFSENLPFSWFQTKVDFAVLKLAHTHKMVLVLQEGYFYKLNCSLIFG